MYDLVGFCGPATCGKDTAAAALLGTGSWNRVAFAGPLKAAALALDPLVKIDSDHPLVVRTWPDAHLLDEDVLLRLGELVSKVGWDEAKKHAEVRRILQVMGTECGRDVFGQDCWVKLARKSVITNTHSGIRTVITDVRFPNEAEMIHEMGGIVVKIIRPGVGPVNSHASDAGISECDFTIYNDADVDTLHRKVLSLVGDGKQVLPIECRECGFVWRAKADPETWNERCPMCEHFTGEPVG